MDKKLYAADIGQVESAQVGESYPALLKFFFPEFISALALYSFPFILDGYFVGCLKSTASYGTLCATNNLIHFVIKIAESVSVGTIILSGRSNGSGDLLQVGRTLRDSFLVTSVLGTSIAAILYFGAPAIYSWYVPEELVPLGVPFLQLRALSVLFMFLFLAFAGFLRGIKNTQTPMRICLVGALVFIVSDYLFIFGGLGIPAFGLRGSALASVMQYGVMLAIALGRVLYASKYQKYGFSFLSVFREPIEWRAIVKLSWPVLLDKSTMAFAYIWLLKMMRPLGVNGVATFGVLKEMERFALIPALALAGIITFLVSNDFGAQNWEGIKSNIKRVMILALGMVLMILLALSIDPARIIQCVDSSCDFTPMAARIFPFLSVLALFDVLQLILSGALRGAANVRVVMLVRAVVCFVYFVPVSYLISLMPLQDVTLKLLLIYGSFYLGNGLMSIVYIKRFRGNAWKVRHDV